MIHRLLEVVGNRGPLRLRDRDHAPLGLRGESLDAVTIVLPDDLAQHRGPMRLIAGVLRGAADVEHVRGAEVLVILGPAKLDVDELHPLSEPAVQRPGGRGVEPDRRRVEVALLTGEVGCHPLRIAAR